MIVHDGRFSERSIGFDASSPSMPACRFSRGAAGSSGRICIGCDVLAVLLRLALQPGHGVVAGVSQPSDPCQSDLGRDGRELPRLAAGAGIAALLDRHRCLCPGSAASSRSLAGNAHATYWSCCGSGGARSVALAGTKRQTVRWFDGLDARHSEKPSGLSAESCPSSRRWLSAGTHRSTLFVVGGDRAGLGNSPLGAANSKANWPCSAT